MPRRGLHGDVPERARVRMYGLTYVMDSEPIRTVMVRGAVTGDRPGTVTALAAAAGCSKSTASRWLACRGIAPQMVRRLLEVLDLTFDDVYAREDGGGS